MKSYCNRCGGIPEFGGTIFERGKVYHRYQCSCGHREDRYVNPIGFDLDDPRAARTVKMNREYGKRIGLYE